MSNLTNEDKSLFADAVKDVVKLNPHPQVRLIQRSHQKQRPTKPRQMAKNVKADLFDPTLDHEDDISFVNAHQTLSFKRPQLDGKTFKRLQKGHFQTQWQLDLHGLTEMVADKQLQSFIREALAENARYLIIIHGKGYNSNTDTPVLKNLVNHRLRMFTEVLAFCSALPKDGGTGAAYVFLQKTAF